MADILYICCMYFDVLIAQDVRQEYLRLLELHRYADDEVADDRSLFLSVCLSMPVSSLSVCLSLFLSLSLSYDGSVPMTVCRRDFTEKGF